MHFPRLVQSFPRLGSSLSRLGFLLKVLALQVLVVELGVKVLVVVHPRGDHVGVLLLEVSTGGLAIRLNIARVVADVIGFESRITPKNMLAPQVGVLTALMHGCVGLEMLLNVQLVLFNGQINVFLVSSISHDPVEVTSDSVLLIVEAIVVCSADGVDVLGHQLADHAPIKRLLAELRVVLTCRDESFSSAGPDCSGSSFRRRTGC